MFGDMIRQRLRAHRIAPLHLGIGIFERGAAVFGEVNLVIVARAGRDPDARKQFAVFPARGRALQIVLIKRPHKIPDVHPAEQLLFDAAWDFARLILKQTQRNAASNRFKLTLVAVQQRIFAFKHDIVGVDVLPAPDEQRRTVVCAGQPFGVRKAPVRLYSLSQIFAARSTAARIKSAVSASRTPSISRRRSIALALVIADD